jgi:hypothetical protein
MATQATYEDVNLVLKLYKLRREEKMRQAREYFGGMFGCKTMEEFNKQCPPGSGPNAYFRMIVSYWDMVASFITSGVLNEDLFFESGREMLFVWIRVKDLVPHYREAVKDPMMWKNLETVSNRFIEYMQKRGPETYETFAARVSAAVKK